MGKEVNKIILAYSGGLDTSVILHWLKEQYSAKVIAFTADIGQEHNSQEVESRAKEIGASKVFIEDLKDEFISEYVFPMFRANTVYEGEYLLGTSIARPLISKRLIEIAEAENADAIAHGATGKGNDQIRFELAYYANNPDIEVIAPWREWELNSRNQLIDFAEKYQISIPKDKKGDPPFSTDANLLHTSSEGKILEDPWIPAPEHVFSRTKSLEDAAETSDQITIGFEKGDPTSINGKKFKPHNLLRELNHIAGKHGVGRIDIVENRFIGMKSRGVYETPGGTILLHAHRAIESITLDKGEAHLKDELMPKYAEIIYNGLWFSSERISLQKIIDQTQTNVSGEIKLKIYKGNVVILGRKSNNSLYNSSLVSFEEAGKYSPKDAEGFIKITSLRLRQKK